MLLSDTAVRQARAEAKAYTLRDGDGLSLFVSPAGNKSWHFRFAWLGKQVRISLGVYPDVSLKRARELRGEARELVALGQDPRHHLSDRKKEPVGQEVLTFLEMANQWHSFKCGRWSMDSPKGSAYQSRRVLDKDLLPLLGGTSFADVSRAQVVTTLKRIEARGALNIAEKARTWVRQIFEYGIAHGYRDDNPAVGLEIIAAVQPPVRHNPILTKEGDDLRHLVRGIMLYQGSLVTQSALWTMLYTGVRTIELRKAGPNDFDLEAGLWRIPPTAVKQLRGKVRKDGKDVKDYVVSIPDQLIPILQRLFRYTDKRYKHAFPGRNSPDTMLSENTLNVAIKLIGLDGRLTGHGIRGTISTALYEMGYPEHLVESQLSHASPNKSRMAYDHAEFVEERRIMMQVWADFIGSLCMGIRV